MKKGSSEFKKGDFISTIPFGVCRVRGIRWIGGKKWYSVKISKSSSERFLVQEALINGPAARQSFS